MLHIRSKIIRYMIAITFVIVVLSMIISMIILVLSARKNAREDAQSVFTQIERVLEDNDYELAYNIAAYRKTCISNAHSIAYMLQYNPDVMDDVKELKRIAEMTEVNEIHIFDTSGTIIKGTNPEYYGMSVNSGDQIGFFKQMLDDKNLELVQDITPNTAEEKLMQYSAVWSSDKSFILQIGMEPKNITRLMEENSLSNVFAMLNTGVGIGLFAIDHNDGTIKGSTDRNITGKNISDIGPGIDDIRTDDEGFNATISGKDSFCIFKRIGDIRVGYVVSNDRLYMNIGQNLLILGISILFVSAILVISVTAYINHYVIDSIDEINGDLTEITSGNLQKEVEVKGSQEFEELSSHINEVIQGILATTDKMSFVLNRTNMRIGVYEYNINMKNVRFTDYVPDILGLNYKKLTELTSDYKKFQEFIDEIKKYPFESEESIYIMNGIDTRYIKLEEVKQANDTFGVLIDMTSEIEKRLLAETDRDIDSLTGLLNRRGINGTLDKLFEDTDSLGYGAVIMADADYLKEVNDKYGHSAGDEYLKAIGESLSSFGSRSNMSGRLGGDEYIMFLYGYMTESELMDDLNRLSGLQDGGTLTLDNGETVNISFSIGYSLSSGQKDYHILMRNADEKMYKNKRNRKTMR